MPSLTLAPLAALPALHRHAWEAAAQAVLARQEEAQP